mgnify:FL=1|jgi:hypothetical protein
MFATVSIKKFPREYLDPVISKPGSDGDRQACTGSGPQASIKLVNACIDQSEPQAPSNKPQASSNKLDMKDIIGYGIARTAARDPAVIGIGKVSLMGPLNASRRDPGSQCRDKMSGGTVTRSFQGYGFFSPKAASIKPQASSPKQQASSSKPQASSSMILDPRYI